MADVNSTAAGPPAWIDDIEMRALGIDDPVEQVFVRTCAERLIAGDEPAARLFGDIKSGSIKSRGQLRGRMREIWNGIHNPPPYAENLGAANHGSI